MLKKAKKQNEGFTIIEVLIVLAIAGLILLIVFLAVPALQRNSRNTQYRSDASKLLAAAQEFMANHNNNLPGASNCNNGVSTNMCTDTTKTGDAFDIYRSANARTVEVMVVRTAASAYAPADVKVNRYNIYGSSKCDTANPPQPMASSSPKQMAMVYSVENSSGDPIGQCITS